MSFQQWLESFGLKLTYPFTYFGQWSKKRVIYNINNCKFILRVWTSDKNTVWDVFKFKEYSPDKSFKIKPSDIVLDIGGNIGAFTVFAARTAKKVYVYEPLKENYDLLNENVKLNGLNNVKSFNFAVSDRVGKEEFFIGKGNIGGSSLYEKSYSNKKIEVHSVTLKKVFSDNNIKRINFLKLDAEGAEYKILLNAPKALLKRIDKIILEFHDNIPQHRHNYLDLKRLLEDNGFDVKIQTSFLLRKLYNLGRLSAKLKFIN